MKQLNCIKTIAKDLNIAKLIQIFTRRKRPQDDGCIATLNINTNALS